MRKQNVLIVAFLFIMFAQVYGQIKVTHVNSTSDKPNSDGILYIMPRTVLKVDIKIKAEEHLKGPLSEYAERFFGIDDAIKYDYTTYDIEEVQLSTTTEPDPNQVYYIESGESDSKELKTLSIQLNRSGYIAGANNIDLGFSTDGADEELVIYKDFEIRGGPTEFIIDGKVMTKIDTIIRKVAVDTIMTEKLFYRSRIIQKTNEDMAVEAMNKIEEIREARYKLLTGFQETAYSAGTIIYMDGELKKQENEYMALFRGKSFVTSVDNFTFYYTPQAKPEKNGVTLFNFSTNTGLTSAGSSSGEKVVLKITPAGLSDIVGTLPNPTGTEGYQTGIFYRIPEPCELLLEWDDDVILNDRFLINQFGAVRNIQNKDFKIELHPETGGVKSVVIK